MSSKMRFEDSFSSEKSLHIIRAIALAHVKNPTLRHLISERDWRGVLNYEWSPSGNLENDVGDRQALAMFTKNASLLAGFDVDMEAYVKFLNCEMQCLATNKAFDPSSLRRSDAAFLFKVQRKIAQILGPFEDFDILSGGFGPGASIGVSRLTSVRRKLSASPTVTTDASKFLPELRAKFPAWHWLHNVTICDVGKLTFVPKTAKTKRPVVIESLVNTFLQKGVGAYIRGRLKRIGVDLSDQTRNQELAREGSLTGEWATLDLSSASDTIAKCVVAELLPYDWWYYLDSIRTPAVKLPDGRDLVLQKFSSMGNGYTFELESLIFYAVAKVASDNEPVSVYGDDIICRTEKVDAVAAGLSYFGFTLNKDKSFWDGPFRESCGRDFLRGVDIRPVYVKGLLSIQELFRLHNFFQRKWDFVTAEQVLAYIPKRFRVYGPDGYGDGHLLNLNLKVRITPERSKRAIKRQWYGYKFKTYQQEPNIVRGTLSGDMAARLWKLEQQCSESVLQTDYKHWPRLWWRNPSGKELRLSESAEAFWAERGKTSYRLVEVYTLNV